MSLDVTDKVEFGNPDDECLPLHKCVCGKKFDHFSALVSVYEDGAWECDDCGRKLFFRNSIKVFEVTS